MQEKERIKVFVKVKNGKTKCICIHGCRHATKDCHYDIVERDRFRGWKEAAFHDRYGR